MLRGEGGVGKTTVADIISARTGWPVRKNIQRLVDGLYGMDITKQACPELYRACSDFIGDAARKVDPLWWVKRRNLQGSCVIDDGRYPDECKDIDWVFFIEARGWTPRPRGGVDLNSVHERWNRTPPELGRIANPAGHPELAADAILATIERGAYQSVRQRIYVSGPYSAENYHDTAANVRAVVDAAEICWARGHEAFCPHSHSHAIACRSAYEDRSIEYERWMEYWFGILDNWATALLLIEHSPGADRELERAISHGHTIFRSTDDVPDVSERSQRRDGARDAEQDGPAGPEDEAGERAAADSVTGSAGNLTHADAVETEHPVRAAPTKETPA